MLTNVYFVPECEPGPRGKQIKERINESYILTNPYSNMFTNAVRSVPKRYIAGELDWYFSGSNKLEDIVKYSKFWSFICNEDQTLNSAYGYLLFKKLNAHGKTQWSWAYDSLVADKDTRQAMMYFGGPDYQFDGNKDFVCTSYGQFMIRNNKLNFHVYMRSNDLIKGATFDIPFFTVLQQNMLVLLREVYPDLEMGYYFHNATSLHIYESDFELVENMLKNRFEHDGLPALTKPMVNKDGEYVSEDGALTEFINTHKI